MDHADPDAPTIKNLNNYLDMFKKKRKIVEDSIHQHDFYATADQQANQKGNNSAVDTGDYFASFGQAYKTTFKKMMGQGGGSKGAIISRKESTNAEHSK